VPVPLDAFVGRAAELTRVAEVVARAGAGQPWLVAIEGDPGVGKTSLARQCLAGAHGLRVLSARAGQAETDLDFWLVDQLLRAAGDVSRPVLPAAGNGSPASSFAAGAHWSATNCPMLSMSCLQDRFAGLWCSMSPGPGSPETP
jgi:AAA ATPase domain